jgi:ABC-2 type transport system permease protein
MLLHILSYKMRSFVKASFDLRAAIIVRGLGSVAVFGAFALGAFWFSNTITRFVLEQTRAGLFLYHQFISMMLFVFFMAVNMGNVLVAYSTLYRSPEVAYFMTKPVEALHIFILKFLDNFLYSSGTLFLMGFMVLLGYGTYFGYPWYFFLAVMVFVLIPFMLLSASLAVVILMAIMKAAGRFGFRKIMTLLFFLYAMIIGVFFRFSNPVGLVEEVNRHHRLSDIQMESLIPTFLSYLPNQWVASFLQHLAQGDGWSSVWYVWQLLAVTLIVFSFLLWVASKFYYRSWLISLQVQSLALAPYHPNRLRLIDFRRGHIFAPQWEVLLKKEYYCFLREPSQWIHLLVMVILTAVFMVSVGGLNLRLRVVDVQLLTYLTLFAFGGFMTSSLALRFVFPMIGLEGNSFWILRSGPVDMRKIWLIKFLIGLAIVLFVAECTAIASNIPFVRWSAQRPVLLWFGVYEAFWISLAVVSLNLGFGAFFANYLEKNPIRAASSQGATLTFLVTLVFLVVQVVVVIVPLMSYFSHLFHFTRFLQSQIVIPGTILAVISMLTAVISSHIGLRAMQKDF